jgi:ketosteroid isomerase-like protein
MSRENVELAHRSVDAFNRRDLDALLAVMDDDVEGAPPLASMEGNYHGHAGIRRWWESLFSGLPDFTIEVVEVRDLGDLTVAVLRNRAHGAVSHTPIEQRLWLVGEGRNGKIIWWQTFRSEAEALEAVALRE